MTLRDVFEIIVAGGLGFFGLLFLAVLYWPAFAGDITWDLMERILGTAVAVFMLFGSAIILRNW